jgi:preprotein translocase subunit SecA
MKQRVDEETVRYLWRLRPMFNRSEPQGPDLEASEQVDVAPAAPAAAPAVRKAAVPEIFSQPKRVQENRPAPPAAGTGGGIFGAPAAAAGAAPRPARVGGDDVHRPVRRDVPKVGRNDDCPCGSGKKYKKCHGAGL